MEEQLPTSPNIPTQPVSGPPPKFLIIGFLVVMIVILVSVLLAIKQFNKPQEPNGPVGGNPVDKETSLVLVPSGQDFTLGDEIRVTVLARSDTDSANLFVARLKFPADILEAKKVDLQPQGESTFIKDWFVTNWVENAFDNKNGSVSLVGGVPHPGFKTPDGIPKLVADVVFTSKKVGSATVSFDDTSAIYRDSDNANILVIKKEVTFKIVQPGVTPTPAQTQILGDANGDGKVDLVDMSALLSKFGRSGPDIAAADLNHDGIVNSFDYSEMVKMLADAFVIRGTEAEVSTGSGILRD